MYEANSNGEIKIKEFVVIQADVDNVENARLYYKEENGSLTLIGDFSGAKGARSLLQIDQNNVETLEATENAYFNIIPSTSENPNPIYNAAEDTWYSKVRVGLPRGEASRITGLTVETLSPTDEVT